MPMKEQIDVDEEKNCVKNMMERERILSIILIANLLQANHKRKTHFFQSKGPIK